MVRVGLVPNLPCGVERKQKSEIKKMLDGVPNLPCGVESYLVLDEGGWD